MTETVDDLLQQRYRNSRQDNTAIADGDAVMRALLNHRSVRAYQDRPLPAGTLETLVAAAQSAATSSNLQAWSLVAVEDPERKARLSELAGGQAHIRQAPLFLVWLADFSRVGRLAERRGTPLVAVDYLDSLLVTSIDAALAAQNFVLAAESRGLGTVYIGGIRNHLQAVIDELQLPPLVFPVFGLCVGYADPARPTAIKPRLPQGVVLHREQYTVDGEAEQIAEYDVRAAQFAREQGQNTPLWSELVTNRLKAVSNLNGRERIAQVLHDQQLGRRQIAPSQNTT